ncbi:MAG: LysM peptidoglycan-binding domain-containing protein [Pseudomonadales bacterium]|nr:LysM peptidoglycan-binding domain-containing protein [Pseudomonadales bacterium]
MRSNQYWALARTLGTLAVAALISACASVDSRNETSGGYAEPIGVVLPDEPTTPDLTAAAKPSGDAADPSNLKDNAAATVAGLTPEQYPDLLDRMRAGFQFADVNNRAVEQQLAYYANNPAYLERTFGRAELYIHHIVQELEARGMPLELALLPVVESAFEPYAMSGARAYGLWQFIPGTGQRFGLNQNWWYEGRRDVIASTRAALDYLQYMHDEFFDDWLLAIAGYNCGEGCVQRAVKNNRAAGKPVDFWHLKLPAETRAYVPKLLAMARLVRDPELYGIAFSSIPNEPYFARVDTGGQVDMKVAAELAGITPEELYELNPGFHRFATPPAGPHYLLVPRDAADALRQGLAQLTPDERLAVVLHTVKPGESVASVAAHYKTQVTVVRDLNGIGNGPLVVGSILRVPSGVATLPAKVMRAAARVDGPASRGRGTRRPVVHVVRRGDSLWRIARRNGTDVRTLARLNGIGPGSTLRAGQKLIVNSRGTTAPSSTPASARKNLPATQSSSREVTYSVRKGDSLWGIARMFNVAVSDLVGWNGISSRTKLMPGQRLTVQVKRR